jgi:hypothetical protein
LQGSDNLSYGRTRKQAKLDEENTFDDIIKRGPSESAKRAFKHDVRNVYGVKQCLTKWGVDLKGAITDGQNNTN